VLGAVVIYGAGWGWNGLFNMPVSSYATAWLAEAGSAVAAATTMFAGDQMIKRREFHGRGTQLSHGHRGGGAEGAA
jgi:hypothetical protein